MEKLRILNAYCGIGGNRKLWNEVADKQGIELDVTAVEYKPEIAKIYQDFFPKDKVVIGDAHQYLLEHFGEFDFIWSSPPCPSHSKARFGLGFHGGKVKAVYPDMMLYQEVILLKHHYEGKWCIENVMAYYKPLIQPQKVGRHWYWANFKIEDRKVAPSRISQQSKKYSKSPTRIFTAGDFEKVLGFNLSKYTGVDKRLLLRNCVEPETGKRILEYAINPIETQSSLL